MHPFAPPCLIASLAACLVASAPPAQAPWSTTTQVVRGGAVLGSEAAWQLLFKSGKEGVSGTTHPQIKAWLDEGDLVTRWADEMAFDAYLKEKGLDGAATWLLVDPERQLVVSGVGLPSPDALAQTISGSLVKSPQEQLRAYLKVHPERGDLWRDQVMRTLMKAAETVMEHEALPGESKEASRERLGANPVWAQATWAMRGLRQVPEWPLAYGVTGSSVTFRSSLQAAQSAFLAQARNMVGTVLEQLNNDPQNEALQALWCNLAQAEAAPDVAALLRTRVPLPGEHQEAGPLSALVMLLEERQDWEALVRLTERVGDSMVTQPGLNAAQWKEARRTHVDWVGSTRLAALLHLGREAEGARWIETCRHWAGSQWEGRKWVGHLGKLPASWLPVLDQPPGPDPVAPSPAPLPVPVRMKVLGDPSLLRRLKAQRRELPLALWPVGAFEVEPVTAEELQRWKKEAPGLAWVLVQEGRELARGTAAPEAEALARILDGARPAPLRDLEAFLRQNPHRKDGWCRKQELLRAGMPHDRLELALCETAERTGMPLKPGKDWRPRPEIWAPVARRVLPRLLGRLERFPHDLAQWEAVLDWMDLHPTPPALAPRILAMGQLALPGHVGALPIETLAFGVQAMARHGRHQEVVTLLEGLMDDLKRECRRGGQASKDLKHLFLLGAEAQEALGRAAQGKAWRDEAGQLKGGTPGGR